MKRALAIGLLCAALGGCDSGIGNLRTDYNTDFQSSGAASGDELLGMMAVTVNPVFTSDEGGAANDSPEARRFTESFASRFARDFAARLRDRGINVASPGRGVPLFRVSVSGYRTQCQTQTDKCKPEALIKGTAINSSGKRIWWFTDWVLVEYMDDAGYATLYRQLLDAMLKDQVIPKD